MHIVGFCFPEENLSNHKGHILLNTCEDCLLWTDTFRNGDTAGRYIMQFSKSTCSGSRTLTNRISLDFKSHTSVVFLSFFLFFSKDR